MAAEGTTITSTDGTTNRTFEETLETDVTTDGVLIFVLDPGSASSDFSWASFLSSEYSSDDLEPWLGSILLSRRHHGSSYTIAHEIGHVLGIFPSSFFPSFERYANYTDFTFEGPEAVRVNGNRPVPFQWLNAALEPVSPRESGADVDIYHPGVCSSVMAYCGRDSLERIRFTRKRPDSLSLTAAGLRPAPARARRIRGGPRSRPVARPSKTDAL